MRLLKVNGESMSPTLQSGDYVLTVKVKPQSVRLGFIYIIEHSDLGRIIKRVISTQNGRYILSGDNPNSTPSQIIAPTTQERIKERVILIISKSGIKRA